MVFRLRNVVLLLLAAGLAACSATYRDHGYIPPADELSEIEVGRDTRDSVADAVGPPGISGVLESGDWYYVRSRFRNFAYRPPEEVDRRVLAISFDAQGVVSNIQEFGLERGRVVRLSRRVTTQNTKGVGLLRQAFGNLGRLDPADFFNDES